MSETFYEFSLQIDGDKLPDWVLDEIVDAIEDVLLDNDLDYRDHDYSGVLRRHDGGKP